MSSSFALGWRLPSAPASVVAPYGVPPVISFMLTRPLHAYGTPTITIPWCSSVVWNDVIVVSWPPCCVPVDANTLPILPTSAPFIHRPPVWSRNVRIWPAMLPKRVGVPKMIAS